MKAMLTGEWAMSIHAPTTTKHATKTGGVARAAWSGTTFPRA